MSTKVTLRRKICLPNFEKVTNLIYLGKSNQSAPK
jgi:hypothetical protein